MRIVHLADTHLGFRQLHRSDERGRNLRELDIYAAFTAAIEKAIELRPACVVHAGDLFDGYHPSAAALTAALDGIERLIDAGLPLVMIAGNHSTPRSAAAQHIFGVLERVDRSGLVRVVYDQPQTVRIDGLAIQAIPHHNDPDVLAGYLRAAAPLADADYNVVVAHTGFMPFARKTGAGEAGSVNLSGEELEAVGEFDYIALGHLHEYDRVRLNAVYSGSLERLTWADRAPQKGIVEVDLAVDVFDDAWHQLHGLPSRAFVELDPIDAAETDDLTGALVAAAERSDLDDAMVRVQLRNVTLAAQAAMDRRAIDEAFSRCLHLDIDAKTIGERGEVSAPQELREFLAARVPSGMDAAAFIARAEGYLARASEEIGA
jgi:exonuclease SbcD